MSQSHSGLQNITITVENGSTTHGDPHLLCTKAQWTDILVFFLSNYLAHVGTVVTYPGESAFSTILALVSALLLPTAGVLRGLTAIVRSAKLQSDPLQTAARAGALCMVVRSPDWCPKENIEYKDVIFRGPLVEKDEPAGYAALFFGKTFDNAKARYPNVDESDSERGVIDSSKNWQSVSRLATRIYEPPWTSPSFLRWRFYDTVTEAVNKDRCIHGFLRISDGYKLAHVPYDAVVKPLTEKKRRKNTQIDEANESIQIPYSEVISATYNAPKAIIAVAQLGFAVATLYRSSGAEIEQYGYSAFGLTVAPYAIMSLVNLLGTIMTPSYPALYLVGSSIMDEAIQQGSVFDGVIGRLEEDDLVVENSQYGYGLACAKFSKAQMDDEEQKDWPRPRWYLHEAQRRRIRFGNEEQDHDLDLWLGMRVSLTPILAPQNREESRVVQFKGQSTEPGDDVVDPAHPPGKTAALAIHQLANKVKVIPCTTPSSDASLFVPTCTHFRRQSKSPWTINVCKWHSSKFTGTFNFATEPVGSSANLIPQLTSWLVGATSLAVYGGLSHFEKGHSTYKQRVVSMLWLSMGVAIGPVFANIRNLWRTEGIGALLSRKSFRKARQNHKVNHWTENAVNAVMFLVVAFVGSFVFYGAPTVLGFVQVAQMIKAYGVCIRLY